MIRFTDKQINVAEVLTESECLFLLFLKICFPSFFLSLFRLISIKYCAQVLNHCSFLYIFSLKEPDFLLIFIVVLDSLKVFKLFRKKCSQLKRWTNVAPTHSKEPLLLTTCHKTHLFKKLNFWKITVLQSQNNIFLPRWFPKSRFLETWQTSAGCAVCPSRMWTSGGQKKSYLQHMNCIWKSRPYKMGGDPAKISHKTWEMHLTL